MRRAPEGHLRRASKLRILAPKALENRAHFVTRDAGRLTSKLELPAWAVQSPKPAATMTFNDDNLLATYNGAPVTGTTDCEKSPSRCNSVGTLPI